MTDDAGSAAHWDGAYDLGDTTRSWWQDRPSQSLRMFEAAGVCSADSVIDVGGGASTLVDALLARGFPDVTVLDISAAGLGAARHRLGARAGRVDWLLTDLLSWQPPRTYTVWHDRAVFHFLTTARARGRYRTRCGRPPARGLLPCSAASRWMVRSPAPACRCRATTRAACLSSSAWTGR